MITRPGTMWEHYTATWATTVLREVLGCFRQSECRRIIDIIVYLDAFSSMTRPMTLEHWLVDLFFVTKFSAK